MTGSLTLRSDDRVHFIIQNADGSVRAYIYKDKGGDGIRINNGADGGGEFLFGKNNEFYSPSNLHAGNAIFGNNGDAYGAAWGNTWLTSWIGSAFTSRDNNINARATIDWVRQNFLSGFRLGTVEFSNSWRGYGYNDQPPYVITGAYNNNADDLIDTIFRRPLQMYINGWRNISWL
ncbi:hypothetical protein P4Q63_000360 [Salmonella enterica]|nr:hypothetical protein [Salmonella enterica]EKQ0889000.1 hypothetical protein [Salmonella enterica]